MGVTSTESVGLMVEPDGQVSAGVVAQPHSSNQHRARRSAGTGIGTIPGEDSLLEAVGRWLSAGMDG